MSSKGSYDPVGKANPQSAHGNDAESGEDAANGASKGGKGEGFTVRVRRIERRNWFILAGAGLLVALVVIVAVVLVTMQNDEDEGIKRYNPEHRIGGERPAFCLLEPDPGMCRAYFEVYHFDAATDSCKMFVYGGCDGNDNRFSSLAKCERDCFAANRSSDAAVDEEEEEEAAAAAVKSGLGVDAAAGEKDKDAAAVVVSAAGSKKTSAAVVDDVPAKKADAAVEEAKKEAAAVKN